MTRLNGLEDSYLAGMLAAIEADAIEVREGIDYRTAAALTDQEWRGALGALAADALELSRWIGSRCSDEQARQ